MSRNMQVRVDDTLQGHIATGGRSLAKLSDVEADAITHSIRGAPWSSHYLEFNRDMLRILSQSVKEELAYWIESVQGRNRKHLIPNHHFDSIPGCIRRAMQASRSH